MRLIWHLPSHAVSCLLQAPSSLCGPRREPRWFSTGRVWHVFQRSHPRNAFGQVYQTPFLWKFACFLSACFWLGAVVPMLRHEYYALMSWMWRRDSHPSLGLQVQKVSAQHSSPVRGWWSFWSAELSAWWPSNWSQAKTRDSKILQCKWFNQAYSFNPSAGGPLLALAVQLAYFLEAPWQREDNDEKLKHRENLLTTEQFVGCVSKYPLVWTKHKVFGFFLF